MNIIAGLIPGLLGSLFGGRGQRQRSLRSIVAAQSGSGPVVGGKVHRTGRGKSRVNPYVVTTGGSLTSTRASNAPILEGTPVPIYGKGIKRGGGLKRGGGIKRGGGLKRGGGRR